MLELEPCNVEVLVEDHPQASVITVGGGIAGRGEITWEQRAKPGPRTPAGELVSRVAQRLCGPGWLRIRYRIGETEVACAGTSDGKLHYVAKPGEVTRVRCGAPEL